jgi:hypothetical protein
MTIVVFFVNSPKKNHLGTLGHLSIPGFPMPPEEEIAQLREAVSNLTQLLHESIEEQRTLREEIGNSIAEHNNNWLDSIIEEAEDFDYDEDDDEDEYDEAPDAKYLELERAFSKMQAEAEAEKKMRADLEAKQKHNATVSAALETLQKSGKVRNPKQLLTLLQSDGVVKEENGELIATSKDKYGRTQVVSLADEDFLGNLLSSDDYAHFANARPGTGTGATPGNAFTATRKHIKEGTSTQDILSLAQNEETWKEALNEIKSSLSA